MSFIGQQQYFKSLVIRLQSVFHRFKQGVERNIYPRALMSIVQNSEVVIDTAKYVALAYVVS